MSSRLLAANCAAAGTTAGLCLAYAGDLADVGHLPAAALVATVAALALAVTVAVALRVSSAPAWTKRLELVAATDGTSTEVLLVCDCNQLLISAGRRCSLTAAWHIGRLHAEHDCHARRPAPHRS